jgi:cysteine desulfurase
MIYLDWAATAVPDTSIINQAAEVWNEAYANPSSEHAAGKKARNLISVSRSYWAEHLGCAPENIIFTSGGTEANNLVLQQLLFSKTDPHAVMTGIEHASVYEPLMLYKEFGLSLSVVSPNREGFVAPDAIASVLRPDTKLVAVLAVHNETGAVQPLEEIIGLVREREKSLKRRVHVHVDAVQAFGKVRFDAGRLDADSAVFSSHKIGGPLGTGVLYVRRPPRVITAGGEQEFGIRPGTENLFSIYGSALAARKAVENFEHRYDHARDLMEHLIEQVKGFRQASLFYSRVSEKYSPYINTVFVPPLPGEAAVRALSTAGVAAGTGSACSTSRSKRTRGLKSMGLEKEKYESALRISTGYSTTKHDIDEFCRVLAREVFPLADTLKKS